MSTKDRIFAAADAITARGDALTQQAIRAEMGGGSFSTIGPALKEWKAANPGAERPDAEQDEVPDSVSKVAHELLRRVWNEAKNEASISLEAMRVELDEQRAEAAREIAESAEIVRIVEGERDHALDLAGVRTAERDAAQEHASQQREAREKADLEAVRLSERLAGAESRLDDSRAMVSRADDARAEANSRAQQAMAERDAARKESDDLRETITALREQIATLTAKRGR